MPLERMTTDELSARATFLRQTISAMDRRRTFLTTAEKAELRSFIKERQFVRRLIRERIKQLPLF